MNTMLTAKEVQQLLQVDRSTVYRMAEDGRLPAIKVGKQWRFPADQLQQWLGSQVEISRQQPNFQEDTQTMTDNPAVGSNLAKMLPLECVQLIQDSHAELLGVMLVITDLDGNPVTEPSNPCGLFSAISGRPHAVQRCISSWHDLGQSLNIEPQYHKSHLGLHCARGLIRVGKELTGMVVAGCIAPQDWPPTEQELNLMAAELNVEPGLFAGRLDQVYLLSEEERNKVLTSVQKVANIIAHIVQERLVLLDRLDGIAYLASL
jgi:excisionase family DNA binding protein